VTPTYPAPSSKCPVTHDEAVHGEPTYGSGAM
jgi:hypothetical protein